jgi:transglutaminase-like putative cysteine protease
MLLFMLELPLITLRIHHKTTYCYRQPVSLGPHRLMVRPRESRDLRLISNNVAVTPDAVVTWARDVFGNAVATANFQSLADNLVIDSVTELQHTPPPGPSSTSPPPPFPIPSDIPTMSGMTSAH